MSKKEKEGRKNIGKDFLNEEISQSDVRSISDAATFAIFASAVHPNGKNVMPVD